LKILGRGDLGVIHQAHYSCVTTSLLKVAGMCDMAAENETAESHSSFARLSEKAPSAYAVSVS
jgi:hypothetical protein